MIRFLPTTSPCLHRFRWLTPHFEGNHNIFLSDTILLKTQKFNIFMNMPILGALRALFVRLRLRANGARDNANVTRRSHYQKSLLRDNDRAVFCAKLVTIYVDWIALLRRLLIWFITSCYLIFGFYMVKALEIAMIT